MDEPKKPESNGEEVAQVGPYQLEEQVAQDDDSQGTLYRARHETSGATTLVRESAAEDSEGAEPPSNLSVRITSSPSSGYDALEVEQTPRAVAPDKQSVESLLVTLEDVHKVVERMLRALSAAPEPRFQTHLGLVKLAGAAGVCILAFTVGRHAPVSPPPSGPEPVVSVATAPLSDGMPMDTLPPLTGHSFKETEDGGIAVLAHPFPNKPFKGQKRPPCSPRSEVEINGGCWSPHKLSAPCPEDIFEYKGQCYVTVMLAPRTPQSLGQ